MKTLRNFLIPPTLLVAAGCLLVCPGCSCRPESPSPTTKQGDAAEQDDTTAEDDAAPANTTDKNEQEDTAHTAPSADSLGSDNATSSPAPSPSLAPRPAPVAETHGAGGAEGTGEGNGEASADGALSSGGQKVTTTPSEARTNAERLAARGKRALAAGDMGAAYQYTLQAWQQLQPHQSDAACQQQIQQLTAQLETIGQQANARFGSPRGTPRNKPVTIR